MYMANGRGVLTGHKLVKPAHYLENSLIVWFFNPLFWLYGLPLISYSVTVWFPLKRNSPGPTKSLKLIKPDGFPDFYHTFESTCKNKGADGTARALRVVPAFNKVGVHKFR